MPANTVSAVKLGFFTSSVTPKKSSSEKNEQEGRKVTWNGGRVLVGALELYPPPLLHCSHVPQSRTA
jgi:hypothetical protein